MTDEVASKALDPLFTTKEVGKGPGLGLSMAFGVAHQSGWHLEVRAEEGTGTRIPIYLPFPQHDAAAAPNVARVGHALPGLLNTARNAGW